MKKNIFIVLFALLAVALNGNAQNNTYNMVIEMANGTKITIGPNDVKNISFNNGELVMTGEDINTLVEQQSKADMRIDSLSMTNKDELDMLWANLSTIQHHLANSVYTKEEINALLSNIQGGVTPDLSNYVTKEEMYTYVKGTTQDLQLQIQALQAYAANNTQAIAVLHQKVNALESKVDAINAKVDAINAKVDAIQ